MQAVAESAILLSSVHDTRKTYQGDETPLVRNTPGPTSISAIIYSHFYRYLTFPMLLARVLYTSCRTHPRANSLTRQLITPNVLPLTSLELCDTVRW